MRSVSALLLVLLLSSFKLASGGPVGTETDKECCFDFYTYKLPLKKIASYRITSTNCPSTAVIFQMVSGKSFCVDPTLKWVKGHRKVVDQRKTAMPTTY